MDKLSAPFNPDQVDALNQYQSGIDSIFPSHPFTCPNRSDGLSFPNEKADFSKATHSTGGVGGGLLIATESGWICPDCGYTQKWAHGFMAPERVAGLENKLPMVSVPGLDGKQIMLDRAEKAIADYLALYMSKRVSVTQSFDENDKSERIWRVVAVALASLRRRRMELLGVTIVDKKIVAVDDTWNELDKVKPADGVLVQMLTIDSQVLNPGHGGYGCNVWTETRALSHGGHYLSIGGMATHWRAIIGKI